MSLAPSESPAWSPPPRAVRLRREVVHHGLRLRLMLILADAFAALAAIHLAGWFSGVGMRPAALLTVPIMLLTSTASGLHQRDELVLRRTTLDEVPQIFRSASAVIAFVWLFAPPMFEGPVGTAGGWGYFTGAMGGMLVARFLARAVWALSSPRERCLLLVRPERVAWLRAKVDDYAVNVSVVGDADPEILFRGGHAAYLELAETVAALNVHRVVVVCENDSAGEALEVLRAAKGLGVRISVVPDVLGVLGTSVTIEDLGGVPVVGVRSLGLNAAARVCKRTFDLVGAGLGLLVLGPVFLAVGLLVKRDSRGPVFFLQTRVGRDGRQFRIVKFRTMVADAEALKADLRERNETEGLFKLADDPRITRVGSFLRRTSLDELPQLFNVLRGDMSLVGPRPLVLDEDAQVTGFDRRRLSLKPGMTGPWQILISARVPLSEMVQIDYRYVANWSLWGDLKILLRTFTFVAARRGL